jgi:hypothetical protein
MKFLSTSFAILFFSLSAIVKADDADACTDEEAAWDACVEANPGVCGTCDATMVDANDSVSAEGLDYEDAAALNEFLCSTLQAIGCVMQSCGCTTCSAEFTATMECSTEAVGVTNCDSACPSGGGGLGDGSGGSGGYGGGDGGGSIAPVAMSVKMLAPILFGSLVLWA